MTEAIVPRTLSAKKAACVTGVPLRQVHRIIDAGGAVRAELYPSASV